MDFSGNTDSADLIALQEALADGSAELTENLPRYDVNGDASSDSGRGTLQSTVASGKVECIFAGRSL